MRTAAGITTTHSRRASNRKKRQEKARKGIHSGGGGIGSSSLEEKEYRNAVRIDYLEECKHDNYDEVEHGQDDPEEEYNEEEEFEPSSRRKGKRKRNTAKDKKKSAGANKEDLKRLKPRSLASILLEESARNSERAKSYIEAEALPTKPSYPTREFCPVTGLFGIYKDPKSGVKFANLKALEQIQERLPPWLSRGGSAVYSEAIKSLRNKLCDKSNNTKLMKKSKGA